MSIRSLSVAATQRDGTNELRIGELIQPEQLSEPISEDELDSAFRVFNDISAQLENSYREMERRVGELNHELNRASEERLKELNQKERLADRLENLLEILPVGVVVLDAQGVIEQYNRAATELLGEPLAAQPWFAIIERCFAPRNDDGHEISLRDGRRVRIETQSLPNGQGQLLALTDMTETRELQNRLSRHQRLSEMGKMVSSLAHQIRTPLSAATLYAGHLCSGDLNQEQVARFSHKLLGRLDNLEQQVRDMLVFARGDMKLSETVSVIDLLSRLKSAAEVVVEQQAATFVCQNFAGGTLLLCNGESVIGALLNLINNGVEAAGRGATIEVSCELDESMEQVMFVVRDDGPGFDERQTAQLMEPFFTTKSQGTGLGLAVVRAVARAHQGHFELLRGEKGAVATLTLPCWNHQGGNAS